ncbi:hypothetical protein [Actinocrispum wychmicini]|uniref:hypothetical protein n=1 Tax=Actinocrispum wychmicini TaxID=1213861 RepID=UPI0010439191|nr:hypothetical protein [Actinocrispum wychmicini]
MTDTPPSTPHQTTLPEWIGVSAGAVAVVASFLPWFTLSGTLADQQKTLGLRSWLTAWGAGFLGWFPTVLLVVVAAVIVSQRFARALRILAPLWLTLAVVAIAMILLRWITVPDATKLTGQSPDYASFHSGVGLYVGLVAAVVSAVTGLFAFLAAQKQVSSAE